MRLGILGGSFDPVHNGHLALAVAAREQANLAQVWFVPAATQPRKPDGPHAADQQRVDMLKLATDADPHFVVSTCEIDRAGPSYTVETLRDIARQRPHDALLFLMGDDALRDLPHWREPAEICRLAVPLVVARGPTETIGYDALRGLVSPQRLGEIQQAEIRMSPVHVSSSELRQMVARGESIGGWVPPAVAQYIAEQGLYRNEPTPR